MNQEIGAMDQEIGTTGKEMGTERGMQEYTDNVRAIKIYLVDAANDFCAIGYHLKQIRDTRQYEQAGYKDVWEMAYEEFGFHRTTALRHIQINDRYSVDGNSDSLDPRYSEFSKSQLQEMIYLPPDRLGEVTPDMPVKEIRELKPVRPEKAQGKAVSDCATSHRKEPAGTGAIPALEYTGCEAEEGNAKAPAWQPEAEGQLSPYGLPLRTYPEGSTLSSKGCGNYADYSCFSCGQDCPVRQENRYCTEAPLGNPFGCTTMHVVPNLRADMGGRCQFVDLGKAKKCGIRQEPDPCCKDCAETFCGYRCRRSEGIREPDTVDAGPGEVRQLPDIADSRDKTAGYPESLSFDEIASLEMEIKTHTDFLATAAGEATGRAVSRREVVRLACELLLRHGRPGNTYDPGAQPDLPALKNMDEREAFVDGYGSWPVWCVNEPTEETFYRYGLPDGSAIVIRQYPCYRGWTCEESTGKDYYLLKPESKHFRDCESNMTALKEHLKDVQKKK